MILRFFFQAEDGIRDGHVTGVQTCALPIYCNTPAVIVMDIPLWATSRRRALRPAAIPCGAIGKQQAATPPVPRSEERRVGKECRWRGGRDHKKKDMDVRNEAEESVRIVRMR